MSVVSFALAVIFIIRLFSTSVFRAPTREDFKVFIKRSRRHSEYIPIYQSSLQRDFCMPIHLVTWHVAKRTASPHWKNFISHEKMSSAYCMHNHCFRTCYRYKIWSSLRNFFAPQVSQAGYGSAGDCCLVLVTVAFCQLCHSAQSFHNQIVQFQHHIFIDEINVKNFILELCMDNDTKIYLRLNRNLNEQR